VEPEQAPTRPSRSESELEELARLLVNLRREGMRSDEVQVLYAQHVLGFSIAELATITGRDRRALYARRDRGRRRLCA
jgi:DNA-directed RNA polymerase specialized sigma24 family protein